MRSTTATAESLLQTSHLPFVCLCSGGSGPGGGRDSLSALMLLYLPAWTLSCLDPGCPALLQSALSCCRLPLPCLPWKLPCTAANRPVTQVPCATGCSTCQHSACLEALLPLPLTPFLLPAMCTQHRTVCCRTSWLRR